MSRVDISTDPAEFITGPEKGEAAKTEGGTTRDSGVATFGASRDGSEGSGTAGLAARVDSAGGEAGTGDTQRSPDAGGSTRGAQPSGTRR